ncbi:hypothetical protein [Actinomadura mexicana]|uniref:Uncharacterized protein n=1 Tax=Actinomadura mexicana TaxID=134959 RepID=A0A238VXH5_9ACTN|nr:hypothetical protein [Actinomadura mexicana]SNR38847.1 hypothetical protein SAMN06265355_102487 [Actinomadura mexicana]
MRSPFADRREDILPRSLADLLAAEAPHSADEAPRRRQRRTRTVRRVTQPPAARRLP